MSFIRQKEIPPGSGNHYSYMVENYREGGHVRQRVLQYLGAAGHEGAITAQTSTVAVKPTSGISIGNAKRQFKRNEKKLQKYRTPMFRTSEGVIPEAKVLGTTQPAILFDDTYKGERYTYGLNYRPLATAQVPDGWIIKSNRENPNFRSFGTVDYPRKLTDHEVGTFQLTPIPSLGTTMSNTWRSQYDELHTLREVVRKGNNLITQSEDKFQALYYLDTGTYFNQRYKPSDEAIKTMQPYSGAKRKLQELQKTVYQPLIDAKEPWQMTKEIADTPIAYSNMGMVSQIGNIRTYYRTGTLPKSGKSWNNRERKYEDGVSVYVTPSTGSMVKDVRDWYYGKGKQIGVGGDEEPLIVPIGKWSKYPGHEKIVKKAISEGKPVPASVLADYPDLKPKEASSKPLGTTTD